MDSLPPGHMVRTLMEEHAHIRLQLDRLEALGRELAASPLPAASLLEEAAAVGRRLIGAEPHHRREEEVLFPELIERGLEGPPSVMAQEHVELRSLKHEVVESAMAAAAGDQGRVSRLVAASRALVDMLRHHILKENNILFPMALGVIRDAAVWDRLRSEADRIGYCCSVLHAHDGSSTGWTGR